MALTVAAINYGPVPRDASSTMKDADMDRITFVVVNTLALVICVIIITVATISIIKIAYTDIEHVQPAIYKLTRER